MIESNIINWIDFGDSMQLLDVYTKKKLIKFFNLMKVLISYKDFSIFFFIIMKFFFFVQVMMITIVNIDKDTDDNSISILQYISKVIFIQEMVTDKKSYKLVLFVTSGLTLIILMCLIYLIISIKIGRFYVKFPISILNIIIIILMKYLIGPIVQISLMATDCKNGKHKYLDIKCYSDLTHLVITIVSVINLVFYLVSSVALSIYYNEIGSINESKVCARINCNYEIYSNIAKIVMFVIAYFVEFHMDNKKEYRIFLQSYVFLNSLFFSFYVYRFVLYYDDKMNKMIQFGWVYVCWFSFVITLKSTFDINDTTIFHLIGWVILGFTLYFMNEFRQEYLLTDFNIFEAKSLKEIELFNITLLNLMNLRSVKAKTLLVGIIKRFEEYVGNSPELSEKYNKLGQNDHLRKKYNSSNALPILSIIFIIYDHHSEKSLLKNDIVLNMCYFLMNKIKNPTFTISLCSKLKVSSHKHLYFKYILMEEIKEYMVNKLSKSNNKESIKHVQIGSVILYNIYMDLFKLKIYDAACNQIEYFDILKNNVSTPKTTENFLKIGEDILKLRKEILKLWEKIVELNPFSDESEKDYMLYLETILQDDILARTESKKYSTLKTNKLSERNNIYHSMFIQDLSSILLVDGYQNLGKILYTTPNFASLFLFTGKEILNMTIDDLIPNVVQNFHKDLIEEALKYSNLNYIFKIQRDMLLKGKNGGIFNIKLFVKCVPNLSYGLIYTAYITKMQDHNFILILDKDFKINGFTEMTQAGASFTMNNNYGLTQGLYGHHISIILPEILLQLEYKDQKFNIPKSEIDLKGNLYPVAVWKELDNKVDNVLDKIKQTGKLRDDDDIKNNIIREYDELVRDISSKYPKPFSVFYKIITKTFLEDKYYYHRVYITNDLIALNENSKAPSTLNESDGNMKKQDLISDNDEKEEKQIKLKVTNSDKANLVEKEPDDIINEKDDDEKSNSNNLKTHAVQDDELMQKGNEYTGPSIASSSMTRSSVDSAGFNKLKNGILEKREISSIQLMKYLCFIFGVSTIGFMLLQLLRTQSNFSNLTEYLSENLYFNHSKIAVSCVYLSTLNLKWKKDKFIDDTFCIINGGNCTDFYAGLLAECIADIKEQKENSSYFYKDFKSILAKMKTIELTLFNLSTTDSLTIDTDNLLNLLVANGLKLNANLYRYYADTYNVYDVNSDNILIQSLDYINDDTIIGFNDDERSKKIKSNFNLFPYSLILAIVLFLLLSFGYSFLVYRLNEMEKYFLEKLIKFHSLNFDAYLKILDDLKKKLRNDTGEDEEKGGGDMDIEIGSKKSKKDDDDEKEGKKGKKHKKDERDDKKMRNKKGSKQNKLQQARNKKKRTMSKFFFRYNLLFILKVMTIIIMSISYYLVFLLIESKEKKNYLSFDSSTDQIEGIYKSSFDIFLSLKTQLDPYEELLSEIKNANNTLINNPGAEVTVGNVTCTNQECLKSILKFEMTVPSAAEITTPKLGNLLMPLVNDMNKISQAASDLNNLYNSDACAILFKNDTNAYNNCSTFWQSILLKGMEQSITQMSVILNTVIDELNSLNVGNKQFIELIDGSSAFSQYELFIEFYLFKAYMKTVEIFQNFRETKLKSTKKTFKMICMIYVIGSVLLFFVMLYFVCSSKFIFNSFLNFIGIIPVKYLMEDDTLYKDVLRLESSIF